MKPAQIAALKKEYRHKNKIIKNRLEEFRAFFHTPVSWTYRNKEMKLISVSVSDDLRLFEELCFCIFAANTSAGMGMRAVDNIRHVLFEGTYEKLKAHLTNIRFNNVRPKYIIHTREYLKHYLNFKLKSHILSYDEPQNLRAFFAENKDIKGIGYKEASHFLRNIGFSGYAILDKHIINSLHEFGVLSTATPPKNPKEYIAIEKKLKNVSQKIGIGIDEMDLLLWSRKTGRIMK